MYLFYISTDFFTILLPVVWSYLGICKSHSLCLLVIFFNFWFIFLISCGIIQFDNMAIVSIHNFLSYFLLNLVEEFEFKIPFMFLFLVCHLSSTTEFWDPIFSSTSNLTHSVDMIQNIHFYAYFSPEVSCNPSNAR